MSSSRFRRSSSTAARLREMAARAGCRHWDGWVESYVGWVRETTDWRNSKIEAKAWPEERNVFKVKWSDKSVLKLCLEDVLKHIVEDDAKWTSRCKQRGGVPPSSGNEER